MYCKASNGHLPLIYAGGMIILKLTVAGPIINAESGKDVLMPWQRVGAKLKAYCVHAPLARLGDVCTTPCAVW